MEITLRLCRPEDEASVAELMFALDAEGAGIRPTNAENVARTFVYLRGAEARGACVVASAGARIVGYALVFPFWSAEYGGLLSLLDEIYVVPELRSSGIGRRLMEWVETHAREQGHVAVSLVAMNKNPKAQRFYESIGYHAIPATSFDKLLSSAGPPAEQQPDS